MKHIVLVSVQKQKLEIKKFKKIEHIKEARNFLTESAGTAVEADPSFGSKWEAF